MALPVSYIGETYRDYGGEKSSFRLAVATIAAANIVAQQALYTSLFNSIDAILTGNIAGRRVVASDTAPDDTNASSNLSQRENKWLLRYHDSEGAKFTAELPTADLSLLASNSEFLVLTGGAGATLKTDFEAVVKSPHDPALSVTLDSVQFVGRRS